MSRYWRIRKQISKLFFDFEKTPIQNKSTVDLSLTYSPTQEEIQLLSKYKIEFIFSEFGAERTNGGGAKLPNDKRLEPSLSTLKKYFPNAKYTVYSDFDLQVEEVKLVKIDKILSKNHPRGMYHTVDYHKFEGLLQSSADIAVLFDSDMWVMSEKIYDLIGLTEKYKLCTPINPRGSVLNDIKNGIDGELYEEKIILNGPSYNNSPILFFTQDKLARNYLEKCKDTMENQPARCPLIMAKVALELAYSPLILPPQWCVCQQDVGIGNEIVLHIGHQKVLEYYNIML